MISERLHLIIDNINTQGEMRYVESTNRTQIAAFEKRNDISLPTQYKEWLCFSDGGELYLPAGIQLYGIEHEPKIDITNNDRPNKDYIVIGALASGDPLIFKKGEEQISIYNHEDNRIEDDETYENFFALLQDLYNIIGIE